MSLFEREREPGTALVSSSAAPVTARQDPPWANATHSKPVGVSGIVIHYGQVVGEEENDEVLRERWYGDIQCPGVADTMIRTDGQIRASIATLVHPITQAIWDTRAAGKTPEYLEHAFFGRYNLMRRLPWDRYLKQALDYLKAGFSLFEILTGAVEVPAELFPLHPSPIVGGKKRVLMITGIQPRLPRTVKRWMMDETDPSRVAGVEQWKPLDDQSKKDPSKTGFIKLDFNRPGGAPAVIRHSFDQVGNDPEGLAQLRSIYLAYKTKRALLILRAIKHERNGLGMPTIKLPAGFNKSDEKKARDILEAVRGHERAYIVLPDGFVFEWNMTQPGAGTDIERSIEQCDREIWMNVLAPFMLLGGNGDTGSYALAETMNDVRLLGLESHVRLLCEPWNIGVDTEAILPWLIRMNYGEQPEYPTLCATNLPTRDWKQIVPEVVNATRAGLITADDVLEAHLRSALYLPPHDASTSRKQPAPAIPPPGASDDDEADGKDEGDDEPVAEEEEARP